MGIQRGHWISLRTGPVPRGLQFGLEGLVSKRRESTYRAGRSPDWIKVKNLILPWIASKTIGDTHGAPGFNGTKWVNRHSSFVNALRPIGRDSWN